MTEEKMDFEFFKEPLGSWADSLRPFVESKEMWSIYQKLKEDSNKEKITPAFIDTFRALKKTERGMVKVVFYLQDPYPKAYRDGKLMATGIPMDCSNGDGKLQPSLEQWYDAIDEHLSKNDDTPAGYERKRPYKADRSPNLEYLLEQGVLLLNTDFTCKLNKTSSHKGLWEPFQKFLLEQVMYGTTGIVYVLCGDTSQSMKRYINPLGNYIIEIEHPAAASHRGDAWRYENIFARVNKILVDNNGPSHKVFWDKDDWDFFKSAPF